uniref:Uncharacterized protein n=1 Tax=Avena sativa TaxID=4498 RepID=A0ACD5UPJ4_AVESA
MADPSYCKSRSVTSQIQQKEHDLSLYLREGDGKAKNILAESKFGYMGVVDRAVYDGRGEDAQVVARAQGQQLGVGSPAGAKLDYFSLAFTDKRFNKSSLKVFGEIGDEEGECAIIGGTGEFACAQGVVTFKKMKTESGSWATKKLHVRAMSLTMTPTDPRTVESISGQDTPPDAQKTPRRSERKRKLEYPSKYDDYLE